MSPRVSDKLTVIQGVKLAGHPDCWDLNIDHPSGSPRDIVTSIAPHNHESSSSSSDPNDTQPPLLLPSLVHPHIHLDKAFIFNEPKYAHLLPASGSFKEALSSTAAAKKNFTLPDLLKRGEWLLAESVHSGVTAMRAFVEVDHTVNLACVEAAVTLKTKWINACEVQIVCFAQDPIISTGPGTEADKNLNLIEQALDKYPEIEVIGTTPYVESSVENSKLNIEWAINRALHLNKHLDFHLDYHLDKTKEPLIWHVLHTLIEKDWTTKSTNKRIMLGHCTRLSLFTNEEWKRIADLIHTNDLPVSFVGLPTSDLYMASPTNLNESDKHSQCQDQGESQVRGTLHVPNLIRQYGLDAVMGVNNLGNAFTPWGVADPLFLANLGVGVYQVGTRADAELLYECVSTRARAAIGLGSAVEGVCRSLRGSCSCSCGSSCAGTGNGHGLMLQQGMCADFVLFCDRDASGCGVSRPRNSVAGVVWDPPSGLCRDVVFRGRLIMGGIHFERSWYSGGTTV